MTAWGMPFVPSVIALNLIDFSDRFFLVRIKGQHELGLYAIGMRISAALLFLLAAFRTAWPAFAFSIPEDEAKRTYGFVLTYVTFFASWAAVALGLCSPWIVRLLTTPDFYGGARVVPLLVFAFVVFGMYVVVVTSIGRAGRRGSNWMITGAAALFNVALNLILIPPFGMTGAAISMVASYFAMFLGITWKAQRVFPVQLPVATRRARDRDRGRPRRHGQGRPRRAAGGDRAHRRSIRSCSRSSASTCRRSARGSAPSAGASCSAAFSVRRQWTRERWPSSRRSRARLAQPSLLLARGRLMLLGGLALLALAEAGLVADLSDRGQRHLAEARRARSRRARRRWRSARRSSSAGRCW